MLGVAIDMVRVDEAAEALACFGDRYTNRFFSPREVDECKESGELVASRLAVHFAAKEAAIKILGLADDGFDWRCIELLTGGHQTRLALSGPSAEAAVALGVDQFAVASSRNGTDAVVLVTALADA